ncbi:MAG: hypothetical protein WC724_01320 [Candidatus Paceibacterota bacterium]
MGWGNWFSDSNGDSVSEKTESRSDGGTTYEVLRDTGGSKSDHQHIIVERSSDGRAERAHALPNKSKR